MVNFMSMKIRIVADEREKPSGVPDLLKEYGLQVEYRMLDVGDYVVSSKCAVERKEERDFFKSLYSGRLFDQAHRLCETYDRPALIVEGEFPLFVREMAKPRAFWGALTTLAFEYGLSVFFTADARQTADLIYTLTKRKGLVRPRGPLVRKKLKARTLEKNQLFLVSSLPGVGPKLADRALRRFRTVRRVFSASVAELSSVEGIGRIKAEKMAEILDVHYHPAEKPPKQLLLDRI
jgi:ERCC4-type nuclease